MARIDNEHQPLPETQSQPRQPQRARPRRQAGGSRLGRRQAAPPANQAAQAVPGLGTGARGGCFGPDFDL